MIVAVPEIGPREVLMRVRVGVPVAQLLLAAGVVAALWLELTRESDERAGLDRSLWATAIGATLVVALSAWTGWALLRLTWRSTVPWPNVVAVLAETATWVLLAPLLVLVPFASVAELLFVPV